MGSVDLTSFAAPQAKFSAQEREVVGRCPMESREHLLDAVRDRLLLLRHVTEVWTDREVVLGAVQEDGKALEFAAEALKGDREVVLAAVQNNGDALEHATEALRADRD
eukprot:6404623-Amphidinium_carterae.1